MNIKSALRDWFLCHMAWYAFWRISQRIAVSDQPTADSRQLPLASCEIVKKYIGYFFFPFSPGGKKGFHSYIDFLLSIGYGQEEGHDFLWYFPFYSFFLRNSSALTFPWQNLFFLFSSRLFVCEKWIHSFSSCGQVKYPWMPFAALCHFLLFPISSGLVHSYSQIFVYISSRHLPLCRWLSTFGILISKLSTACE